jgi:hypothetical protein
MADMIATIGRPPVEVHFGENTVAAMVARIEAQASAAQASLSAATAESAAGPTYPDTAAGLAATIDGQAFAVDNGDGTVTVYLNDSGNAVAQRTLATTAALASSTGWEMVKGQQSGSGSILRLTSEKLAERITPEDYGAAGDGSTPDGAAVLDAANAAVAQGKFLRGRRGATYLITSALTLPTGLHFDGEGCTFKATTHFAMLSFLGGGVRFYNCTIEGPDDGTYNGSGKGLRLAGSDSGIASTPPNMIEDIAIEGVNFVGIGHTALDLWYSRGVRIRDVSGLRIGYQGVLGFSCEDIDGKGFDFDTFYGESGTGELNAYAVAFSSLVGTSDHVRNPPSRRCYAHSGTVKNLPTWHALDTHGGENIGFQDWNLYDVRRGVAITNRGTASAQNCYVRNIRSINRLPFVIESSGEPSTASLNSNGTLKRDSALWITGASGIESKGITVENFYAEGHGRPAKTDGSFFLENTDAILTNITDYKGFTVGVHVNGGFNGRIERHQCIDLFSWAGSSYPGGSWANLNSNASPRPLDSASSTGGKFAYEGIWRHPSAFESGVTARDFAAANLGTDHQVEIVGDGVRGKTAGGPIISGTSDYLTGNVDLSVTLTATGFSGTAPTGSVALSRADNVVHMTLPAISGTSNATTMTIGTLPPNFRPKAGRLVIARGKDNGTDGVVLFSIATSGVITCFWGAGAAAFTASGTKGLAACTVSYPI